MNREEALASIQRGREKLKARREYLQANPTTPIPHTERVEKLRAVEKSYKQASDIPEDAPF